jgi:hypothetical protein
MSKKRGSPLSRMKSFVPEKLQAPRSEKEHAEKDQPMAPALNVGCSIFSLVIMHRNLNNL